MEENRWKVKGTTVILMAVIISVCVGIYCGVFFDNYEVTVNVPPEMRAEAEKNNVTANENEESAFTSDVTEDDEDTNVEDNEAIRYIKSIEYKDISSKEKIAKYLFKNYDESKENLIRIDREEYSGKNMEYYYVDDIDGDSHLECLVLCDGILTMFRSIGGDTGYIDTVMSTYHMSLTENPVFYKVEDKETHEIKYLFQTHDSDEEDMICYVSDQMLELDFEQGNPIMKVEFKASCNREEEERKRKIIDETPNMSDEEREIAYKNAHTLEYLTNINYVSEEEYNEYIKNYGMSYNLLVTSSTEKTIFDETKPRKEINDFVPSN